MSVQAVRALVVFALMASINTRVTVIQGTQGCIVKLVSQLNQLNTREACFWCNAGKQGVFLRVPWSTIRKNAR